MNISKINIFLSTFNLFLIFIGYQIVTTAFLPNTVETDPEDWLSLSRGVTIPYRVVALVTSIVVIVINRKSYVKLNVPMTLYFLFWGFLSLRIIYDLEIRTDITVDPGKAQNTILYMFLMCLIPAYSVYRSIKSINFSLAFKWIFAGYIILIPLSYYNNPLLFSIMAPGVRLGGNIAFNTIAFGHYGGALTLLALFWKTQKSEIWFKIVSYILMLVGIFIMLRAGSRGPLVTLLICLLFYFIASQKTSLLSIGLLFLSVCMLLFFSDVFFKEIQQISPIMADRMTLSGNINQYEELATGRSGLYQAAIDGFLNNPVFGQAFAIFRSNGTYSYSHNIVFDAFMGLGLFGGILFVVILFFAIRNSFLMIRYGHKYWWLALLCIQYIVLNMFSGCFYQSDTLNAAIIIAMYPWSIICRSQKEYIDNVLA